MSLNIEEYANFSIVPIICGQERGTAFFIDSTHLLTANHIIRDNIENSRESLFSYTESQ